MRPQPKNGVLSLLPLTGVLSLFAAAAASFNAITPATLTLTLGLLDPTLEAELLLPPDRKPVTTDPLLLDPIAESLRLERIPWAEAAESWDRQVSQYLWFSVSMCCA
jgi:hypothetical protein